MKLPVSPPPRTAVGPVQRDCRRTSDRPPRLAHNQLAGCHIPSLHAHRPIRVQTAHGQVTQVQSRGTQPANRLCRVHHLNETSYFQRITRNVHRKTGSDKCPIHLLTRTGPDRVTVERCSLTPFGTETLLEDGIEDRSTDDFVAASQGHRHRVVRKLVDIIESTVQRVHDPAVFGIFRLWSRRFLRSRGPAPLLPRIRGPETPGRRCYESPPGTRSRLP